MDRKSWAERLVVLILVFSLFVLMIVFFMHIFRGIGFVDADNIFAFVAASLLMLYGIFKVLSEIRDRDRKVEALEQRQEWAGNRIETVDQAVVVLLAEIKKQGRQQLMQNIVFLALGGLLGVYLPGWLGVQGP